ncbi:MAG: protein kinase [Butyrivibrio sp.]|nr:protein kinase [Butyrivibrio sp.]
MSEIIAGLYELNEKIGAGGGGVVYLGRHIRLDKTIVLKADKRSLKADTSSLRREVDLLKGLSQTYIPQVYDFVQENDVVYTVMDYIDGESLDKRIKRGQLPSQPELVKWARQILEALEYLHTRPPHGILHADIKPANIMLRSNGDICLIDYNIALALGEDGAVKVGYSRGYASPEHYTEDFSEALLEKKIIYGKNASQAEKTQIDEEVTVKQTDIDEDKTVPATVTEMDEQNNKGVNKSSSESQSSSSYKGKTVMLDARSDIYSLGATLYHLISGNRPAEHATDVIPLDGEHCSIAIAEIINKAMAPLPEDRFQTASEMLKAFNDLYKNDPRVIARRKRIITSAAIAGTVFLVGGALTFVGLKQMEQRQNALALSEYSGTALEEGDVKRAVELALEAMPEGTAFAAPVTSNARLALTSALGVYELDDCFDAKEMVKLPAEPFHIVLSPSGDYFCVTYAYETAIYSFEDTSEPIVTLKVQQSALSDVVFLDDTTIIYAGENGVCSYNFDTKSQLWQGKTATNLSISGNRKVIAAINRSDENVVVYDTKSGEELLTRKLSGHIPVPENDIFADPDDEVFALNESGNEMAISFSDGSLQILDLNNPDNDLIIFENSDYDHFEGCFVDDNFAVACENQTEALFYIIDVEEGKAIADYSSNKEIHLKKGNNGLFLSDGGLLVYMDSTEYRQQELLYNPDAGITDFYPSEDFTLASFDDGSCAVYDKTGKINYKKETSGKIDFIVLSDKNAVLGCRDNAMLSILEKENHSDTTAYSYDAYYPHDEARISSDGNTIMLFSIEGFRIYDKSGNVIGEYELEEPGKIYDQIFVRDGAESYLEVTWYDGTVRKYSASDGKMISESLGDAPDKDLYEEFFIDNYRIASSLHDAPVVYDKESGKVIASLSQDAFLTYVSKTSEGIIAEFVDSKGQRYGELLNDRFEVIAMLPDLCDVKEDTLYFDYGVGTVRQCRLFSLRELKLLGENISTH